MKKREPFADEIAAQQSDHNPAKPASKILDMVSLKPANKRSIEGVLTGTLQGFTKSREPLVDFPENANHKALVARTAVTLSPEEIGREVVLMFDRGDMAKPMIMGVIRDPQEASGVMVKTLTGFTGECITKIDGERLIFDASDEVTLRCGKSSIALHKDGKVVIRGEKIVSRAAQENKIKGGSVAIN